MKVNSNNGLSPTMVIRFIRERLGALLQTIELTDQEIMKVVNQQTLPTFSHYFPFKPIVTLTNEDKVVQNGTPNQMEYRLPNPWNLQILSFYKYYLGATCRFGCGWIAPFLTNPVDAQLMRDRLSMYTTPLIIEFWPPNRIVLKTNYYNATDFLSVQFTAVHPTHLKTIQPNLRDEFLELALLDVKCALWPLKHRFNTISTTYASIELFTELVDNAKDERASLLERWESKALFNGDEKRLTIM